MSKKIVIVGGVAGGASAAARLRRLDEHAEIVVFERGDYVSYANCGLPYHISDVISEREMLLLHTPESLQGWFDVDVRVASTVVAINRDAKTVTVKNRKSGESYEESYDKLILATGSSPLRPGIPGIESEKIETLWTIPDTDRIRAKLQEEGIKKVGVIGGGFIGLEMVENLVEAGKEVALIEAQDQVMAPVDYEMAQVLHSHLLEQGVDLHLSDGVAFFEDVGDKIAVSLASGNRLEFDLVILSIGVRPNSEIAKDAGLDINERGGVITDKHMVTSDPDIYAVGDVVQVEHFVSGEETMIPLAGPANKQGRIAAGHIAGLDQAYTASQGTAVAKVFELTVASTGLNEKQLQAQGKEKGKDYESLLITQNSHAGYYPGAEAMHLKLIFSADGEKIFGAQIVGRGGVDKRMDVLATAQRLGASVADLKDLELAYAPPYSSAKDPVNMAGFVAENILEGRMTMTDWDVMEKEGDALTYLDVREDEEREAFEIPAAVPIPLWQVRSRFGELDKTKPVVVFCAMGVRAYNAARVLAQEGFEDVRIYPGGTGFYRDTHYEDEIDDDAPMLGAEGNGQAQGTAAPLELVAEVDVDMALNCAGLQCPGPLVQMSKGMEELQAGQIMEVLASDPGFYKDAQAWTRRTGNSYLGMEKTDRGYRVQVQKGAALAPTTGAGLPAESRDGKTIIVFSGELDKVMAAFIIANGAAAMGRPVTMFFTFWGLTALRRRRKVKVAKEPMEKMFSKMLPRGTKKLPISKMNMGGLGAKMMKKIMKQKNVASLEELIVGAKGQGVKIIACTMSMDVMGIKEEELIPGVELAGVGAYLGDAEESDVNLFIG